jgi:DNA-binding FadR family transcriptional regulator
MSLPLLDEEYAVSPERVAAHREIAEACGGGEASTVDRLLRRHLEDASRRLSTI